MAKRKKSSGRIGGINPLTGLPMTQTEAGRLLVESAYANQPGVNPYTGTQQAPLPLPAGTYDPGIDAQVSATNRGFGDLQADVATQRAQGQENYNLSLADLMLGRDRTLGDIRTQDKRINEDYDVAASNLNRQYGILGRQQAENAARAGITSQGLLHKSAVARASNKQLDQDALGKVRQRGFEDLRTAASRADEDYSRGRTALDLDYSRTFGGTNPLTGSYDVGSLATQLARAGRENTLFGSDAEATRRYQAAQAGYTGPLYLPNAAPKKGKKKVTI